MWLAPFVLLFFGRGPCLWVPNQGADDLVDREGFGDALAVLGALEAGEDGGIEVVAGNDGFSEQVQSEQLQRRLGAHLIGQDLQQGVVVSRGPSIAKAKKVLPHVALARQVVT